MPCVLGGDDTPQSSFDKVIGSLGLRYFWIFRTQDCFIETTELRFKFVWLKSHPQNCLKCSQKTCRLFFVLSFFLLLFSTRPQYRRLNFLLLCWLPQSFSVSSIEMNPCGQQSIVEMIPGGSQKSDKWLMIIVAVPFAGVSCIVNHSKAPTKQCQYREFSYVLLIWGNTNWLYNSSVVFCQQLLRD